MSHRYLIVLLFAIACVQGFAQSSAALGSVSAQVLDPQGRPIAGATITLRNTDFATVRTLITDDDGKATADFIPAGSYTI